jgi:hypothetical protein
MSKDGSFSFDAENGVVRSYALLHLQRHVIAGPGRLHRLVLNLHGADGLHEVCSMAQKVQGVAHVNCVGQCQDGNVYVIKEVSYFSNPFASHVAPPLRWTCPRFREPLVALVRASVPSTADSLTSELPSLVCTGHRTYPSLRTRRHKVKPDR